MTASNVVRAMQSSAIVASLLISRYGGNKKDQSLTREVSTNNHASEGKLSVQKKLLACPEATAIQKKDTEIRIWFNSVTARWDEGKGLVPSARIVAVKVKADEMIRDRADLVEKFLAKRADLIRLDQIALNGAFDPNDYPSESELRARFGIKLSFRPVETTFATTLIDESLRNQLQADLDQAVSEQFTEAKRELTERIAERLTVLVNAINRLGEKDGARLHKSLVSNVIETCEQVKQANFDADPTIDGLADKIADIANRFDPDAIRENETVRDETKEQAQAALAEVQQAMAGFVF